MKLKLNWGTGIALVYGIFFIVVVTLVVILSITDWDLVSNDYYQKEISYQEQIDKEYRTGLLKKDIKITYVAGKKSFYLFFPETLEMDKVIGNIHFFRPSDASRDQTYDIMVNTNGIQVIEVNEFLPGNWRIKINWTYDNIDYYQESQVVF